MRISELSFIGRTLANNLGNGEAPALAKVLRNPEVRFDHVPYTKNLRNIPGVSPAWFEACILAVTLGQS